MKFNLGHILNRIRPKTQWVVTDEKISRWDSEEPEPTLEELEAGRKGSYDDIEFTTPSWLLIYEYNGS